MASVVFDTLEEFDIKEKFYCVTTDSAKNNLKMVKVLSRLLLERCNIEWGWETNHIPCLAHIINLVVQKFLKTLAIKVDDDVADVAEIDGDTEADDDEVDEDDITTNIPDDDDDFDTKLLCRYCP